MDRLLAWLPAFSSTVDAIYLRWLHGDTRRILRDAAALVDVQPRPLLLGRSRVDLARAAGLDGVILPESGLSPARVRSVAPDLWIGASRHDQQGLSGRTEGADFATLSPVHSTSSKPGRPGLGLARFRELVSGASVPVLALGGLGVADVESVLRAGAHGLMVQGGVLGAPDPVAAASAMRAALDRFEASR